VEALSVIDLLDELLDRCARIGQIAVFLPLHFFVFSVFMNDSQVALAKFVNYSLSRLCGCYF
jgi:hypothetical protein